MKSLKQAVVVGMMVIFPMLAFGTVQMKFVYPKGSVQISRAGKTYLYKWNQIPKAGIRLALGDKLRIGPTATVGLNFLETGDRVLLYSNSLFVVREVKKEKSIVDLWLGKAKFLVKKALSSDRQRFQVRTRGSIIGVKGTEFWVNTSDQKTSVLCLEGEVELKSPQFPNVAVSVKANQLSLATQGQKPLPSVDLEEDTVKSVSQSLSDDKPVNIEKIYQDSPVADVQATSQNQGSSGNQENQQQDGNENSQQEGNSQGQTNSGGANTSPQTQVAEIPEVETSKVPEAPKIPETPKVPDPVPAKKDSSLKLQL